MSVWPALVCLLLTLVAPLLWVPLLRRWGAVDVPNARSSHSVPTIRGAGLAPLTGIVLAGFAWAFMQVGNGARPACVVGFAALLAGVGLAEDVAGLAVGVRAGAQLVLGAAGAGTLCLVLGQPWWFACVGAVFVAAYVNAANFMDGVDGMSALHGLVCGVHFVAVGLVLGETWIAVMGSLLATGFLGFAPWNLLRGRVFLGDVGSYLLGGLVALVGVAAALSGAPLFLALAPSAPYLADTGFTLLLRARRGEPLLASHRGHVYQRLNAVGWSHLRCATFVAATSAACSACAFWSRTGGWSSVAAWAAVLLVLAGYLSAPRWQPVRQRRLA